MMIERNRLLWVDYAKGIGIILVVLGHENRGLIAAGFIEEFELFSKYLDNYIYAFHMPLFFFLSGIFFLSSAKANTGTFFSKKIATIVYPYFVWSFFQGGVEVFFSKYTNGNTSWGEIVSFWEPRAQFWFLFALFFIFVISYFCYKISGKNVKYLILLSFLFYFFPTLEYLPKEIYMITNNLIFFSFGAFFSLYYIELFNFFHKIKYRIFLFFLLFISLSYCIFNLNLLNINKISVLILAILGTLSTILFSDYLAKYEKMKFLAILGSISMQIYLLHILVMGSIRVFFNKFLHIDSYLIHLFLGTIITIIICYLMNYLIKKFRFNYIFSYPVKK